MYFISGHTGHFPFDDSISSCSFVISLHPTPRGHVSGSPVVHVIILLESLEMQVASLEIKVRRRSQ